MRDTIQPYTETQTQIKVKGQGLYCCSTYHSHSKVINNDVLFVLVDLTVTEM
jgi:hypothetical protein